MKSNDQKTLTKLFNTPDRNWDTATDAELLAEADRALGHVFAADPELQKGAQFLYLSALIRTSQRKLARIVNLSRDEAERWGDNLRFAEIWHDEVVNTDDWFGHPGLWAFAADVLVTVGRIRKTWAGDFMDTVYAVGPGGIQNFIQEMTQLNLQQHAPSPA